MGLVCGGWHRAAGCGAVLLIHVFPWIRRHLTLVSEDLDVKNQAAEKRIAFDTTTVAEAIAQVGLIVATLWLTFGPRLGSLQLFYLSFVPVIWIAMRQGIRRAVCGVLAVNFGMVIAMDSFSPPIDVSSKVGLLMLVISGVGLVVGSEVSERHRLAIDLHQQTTYLDSLIQNSPLGIVVLDRQGRVELANVAFEKLFHYEHDELSSIELESLGTRDDEGGDCRQLIAQIFAGKTLQKKVRQRCKDGRIIDLALHGVPLLANGKVRGAYLIYQDISQQIKAAEAQRQHAESLNQLVRELELNNRQMSSLNEMGALLECSGTVKEACAVVAESVPKLFPETSSGALYLFKSSRNLVEAALRWGREGCSADPTFAPDACWSLRRGHTHWSEHPGSGVSCAHLTESSSIQCLCIPMVAQGNTLGILHLEFEVAAELWSDSSARGFRDSHQRLAISVASQIALSLASLQLRDTLREQSIRDPLTRLFNRRFMEESLEREIHLAGRKGQPVSVLFIDLDHFKSFNDTFGHDAGDLVLQSIADLFRAFFRATDICCRYGGEEFAIIMTESSGQDSVMRANALRAEVRNLRLNYQNKSLGTITLSAGVAAFPEHGLTSAELLKAADQCLYESKSLGRDMVTVAASREPAYSASVIDSDAQEK